MHGTFITEAERGDIKAIFYGFVLLAWPVFEQFIDLGKSFL